MTKKLKTRPDERCLLYPSDDTLGRRDCTELSALLSETEKDFLFARSHMLISEDCSAEPLGLYGLHETLEAISQDQSGEQYREQERDVLSNIKDILIQCIEHGLRYGMPMRVTSLQTSP